MNNLPSGWSKITLEEIALFIIGGDWGIDPNTNEEGFTLTKVIKGTDLKFWGKERAKNATIRLVKNISLIKRKLEVGDIIIEVSGGGPDQPVGRTIIIDNETFLNEELPLICSNFFRKLTISKLTNPFYVQYYLEYAYVLGMFNDMQSHTTNLRNLKVPEFLKLNVPLPSYQEQVAIADKIKSTLQKLDEVKRRLERIPIILSNINHIIFTAAVNGELTEDWRKDNTNVVCASDLLERIISSRKNAYEEKLKLSENNDSPKPRLLKANLDEVDSSYYHDIPDTWVWTKLINIAEIASGVTKGRKFGTKPTIELPYLRVANVQDGYLNLKEIKTIEVLSSDLEKYRLLKGDILFTEGGDRDKLGRGTVWNEEIPNCIHQNHIIRARVDLGLLNPYYISYFTKTKVALDYFYNNANQTVNLASISLTSLSNVPIALPPFEEQNEIVKKMQSLFALIETIESRYKRATEHIENVKKALYQKAFSGQLVASLEFDSVDNDLVESVKKEKAERERLSKLNVVISTVSKKLKADNIMEIVESLINNGGSMKPFDLWKATKYADNIEDFYNALKIEVDEKKSVKENNDKSLLQLSNNEN